MKPRKPKFVGFNIDPTIYDDAVKALNLDALTVSEYLVEQLTSKASEFELVKEGSRRLGIKERDILPRKVTEIDLATLLGKHGVSRSRATLAKMRAAGEFDGFYQERGRFIVYDVASVLAYFNVEAKQ